MASTEMSLCLGRLQDYGDGVGIWDMSCDIYLFTQSHWLLFLLLSLLVFYFFIVDYLVVNFYLF